MGANSSTQADVASSSTDAAEIEADVADTPVMLESKVPVVIFNGYAYLFSFVLLDCVLCDAVVAGRVAEGAAGGLWHQRRQSQTARAPIHLPPGLVYGLCGCRHRPDHATHCGQVCP